MNKTHLHLLYQTVRLLFCESLKGSFFQKILGMEVYRDLHVLGHGICDQNTNFAKCQMAFLVCIIVRFSIQTLKSKHLVCLRFLLWEVFLREREKIFCTYFGPKALKQPSDANLKAGCSLKTFRFRCTQMSAFISFGQ